MYVCSPPARRVHTPDDFTPADLSGALQASAPPPDASNRILRYVHVDTLEYCTSILSKVRRYCTAARAGAALKGSTVQYSTCTVQMVWSPCRQHVRERPSPPRRMRSSSAPADSVTPTASDVVPPRMGRRNELSLMRVRHGRGVLTMAGTRTIDRATDRPAERPTVRPCFRPAESLTHSRRLRPALTSQTEPSITSERSPGYERFIDPSSRIAEWTAAFPGSHHSPPTASNSDPARSENSEKIVKAPRSRKALQKVSPSELLFALTRGLEKEMSKARQKQQSVRLAKTDKTIFVPHRSPGAEWGRIMKVRAVVDVAKDPKVSNALRQALNRMKRGRDCRKSAGGCRWYLTPPVRSKRKVELLKCCAGLEKFA